jgi:MYXO-CTERM domain-containing protein
MSFLRRFACLAAVCTIAVAPARAVTVYYSATINSISGGLAPLNLIGEVVSGSFTYNASAPDTNAASNLGTYNSAVTAASMTIASFSDTVNAGTMFTGNNDFNGTNTIDFVTLAADIDAASSTFPNIRAYRFDITLTATDLGMLTSDDLPTAGNFPELGDLSSAKVRLLFASSQTNLGAAIGDITYLSFAPPTPPTPTGVPDGGATAGMVALALAGGAALRRRMALV